MKWSGIAVLALLLSPVAQSQQPKSDWDAWRFLLGNWVGEGSGEPGRGVGAFSFQFDLQGTILIRKNYAEYPATKQGPAYRHDDLMIIYSDSATKQTRAFYIDSESHVIHYTAIVSGEGETFTLLGDVLPSLPRYRLRYQKIQDGRLKITFEIAPPGKPEQFAKYLEAVAHKTADAK